MSSSPLIVNPMEGKEPMREQVMQSLREFIAEGHPEKIETLEEETDLFKSGVLDSLGVVSLVTFIDEKFGCSLDFEELTEENLANLKSITALVLRKMDGKSL